MPRTWVVLVIVIVSSGGPRVAQATPDVGISAETLNQVFTTATTTGSYAHVVPSTGSNRILIVTVGSTGAAGISSIVWDPDTTVPANEQTLTCPPALTILIGTTGRRIAICTLLNPTASSGNGRVTITLAASDTFTSSATTMTGVASTGSLTGSTAGKTFASWTACVAVSGYTCTVPLTTVTDQILFDLMGQGEPTDNMARTYTASGTGQKKHEDSASLVTGNNNRVATSITIAMGTTTTLKWVCGSATSSNSVGEVILTLTAASSVTAASPSGLEAVRYGTLGTRLSWRTEEEVSHLGFRVWRDVAGERTRLGNGFLPGSMFATGDFPLAGRRRYELWDPRPVAGALYWLEEIGATGSARWHGPLAPTTGDPARGRALRAAPATASPTARASLLASREGARAMPIAFASRTTFAASAPGVTARADQTFGACANPAASRASVKIGVSRPGWYRVDAAALVAAGLPPDVDPAALALSADGAPVAMKVRGQESLEAIEFYGTGLDTRETATRVYWLTADAGRGQRVTNAPRTRGSRLVESYQAQVERRERTIYFAALLNGDADNFFGAPLTDVPVTQTLEVTAPAVAGAATLEVVLQGATFDAHEVQVSWAGVSVGRLAWTGRASSVGTFDVPAALLREGIDEVRLTPVGGAAGISLVDHVSVTYPRRFAATGETLAAVIPAGASARLTGFSSPDVRVVDLSDARAPLELPVEVTASGSGFVVRVSAPHGGEHAGHADSPILAFTAAGISSADSVTANRPSSLCGTRGGELAVVAPRAFFDALAPLVAARRAQGWSVELLDVEDIYDEMSYGAHTAAALTSFVRARRQRNAPRLRDLLLVGDASLDPRDFLGKDVPDVVPTRLVDTATIETASDEALADLDGDGGAELAVGRWPARTPDDVRGFVTRTLELGAATAFARGALVIAGASTGFDFAPGAAAVRAAAPGPADLVDASGLPPGGAAAAVASLWARGPSFVAYLGHGSQGVWEGLLSMDDLSGTGPVGKPAVVAAMTCLNGFFQDVYGDCLAERLMRAPNGAAAVWASSTLEDGGALSQLAVELESRLATQSLGEAARAAKAALPGAATTMVLFGDPTLFGHPTVEPNQAVTGAGGAPVGAVDEAPPASPLGDGCALTGSPRRGTGSFALLLVLVAAAATRRRRRS